MSRTISENLNSDLAYAMRRINAIANESQILITAQRLFDSGGIEIDYLHAAKYTDQATLDIHCASCEEAEEFAASFAKKHETEYFIKYQVEDSEKAFYLVKVEDIDFCFRKD